MTSRHNVIQTLLDLFDRPTSYLEIGVSTGATFQRIQSERKVAVDPRFLFETSNIKAEPGSSIEFHEVRSDDYFGRIVSNFEGFDVVYLDGLHTFEQTLRDLVNCIRYSKPEAIIVIDDVSPNSYHASLPDQSTSIVIRKHLKQLDPSWMGDVYKLVFFIETFFQQYSYATISDNHGQLVLWPERRLASSIPHRTVENIGLMQFADFVVLKTNLRFASFSDIIDSIKSSFTRSKDIEVKE